MKAFETTAYLKDIKLNLDKSVALKLVTPEITDLELGDIRRLHGFNVMAELSPLDVEPIGKTTVADTLAGEKTPAHRQYNAIYGLYRTHVEAGNISEKKMPFHTYYNAYMDDHIRDINKRKEEIKRKEII